MGEVMKKFWISWAFRGPDERPIEYPPPQAIAGWWKSGYDSDNRTILCAMVYAISEDWAKREIENAWVDEQSGIVYWRFCEEKELDWEPNDRFPLSDWMRERNSEKSRFSGVN